MRDDIFSGSENISQLVLEQQKSNTNHITRLAVCYIKVFVIASGILIILFYIHIMSQKRVLIGSEEMAPTYQ